MVVNGACAADWPEVEALGRQAADLVQMSFGWHPWYLHERLPGWQDEFCGWLDRFPGAAVGEIGIDRWILGQSPDLRARYVPELGQVDPVGFEEQVAVFQYQLEAAAVRNRPVTIHCLQAWGRLVEVLRRGPVPPVGFLVHSYGGPAELVPELVRLGGYFGFAGYFLHQRKRPTLEVFRSVPRDRLLVETDAPDQTPPPEWLRHELGVGPGGRVLNHPANLPAIQEGLGAALGVDPGEMASQLEENFLRLFGLEGALLPPGGGCR